MSEPLRVVFIEDQPDDARLLEIELCRAGLRPVSVRVETPEELRAALSSPVDVILSDYCLPGWDGLEALRLIRAQGLDVPFIFVSGTIGEDQAVAAMREGATDYLLKDRLGRLGSAVRQAVELRRLQEEKRRGEAAARQLATLVQSTGDAIISETLEGVITSWNPAAERLYGWSAEEVLGRHISTLVPPDKAEELVGIMAGLRRGEGVMSLETVQLGRDGQRIDVSLTISPVRDGDGQIIGCCKIARDITEKVRLERERARLLYALNERVKELRALHQTATLLHDESVEPSELFGEVTALLPAAWQYPEVAGARITCGGHDVSTPNYRESPWRQAAAINGPWGAGLVEVVYVEQRPEADEGPFLREEREVLESVAEMLRGYLERRQAGDAARASEARFKAVVEKSHDAVVLLDADGTIRYASPACERIGGRPVGDFLGRNMREWVCPDDRPAHARRWEDLLLRPGGTTFGVTRFRRADGTWGYSESTHTNLLGDPDVRAVVANFRDVTERVEAEAERRRMTEELSRTARLLQTVVQNTPDAIFVKDQAGRYLLFNEAAGRFTGRTVEEVIGQDDTVVFGADDARQVMEGDRRVIESGRVLTQEEEVTVGGVTRVFQATKAPYRDDQGQVIGLVGISRDVTTQKRAEQALREGARLAAFGRDVGLALANAATAEEMLGRCVSAMVEHLDAAFARIWTLNEAENVLELRASAGMYTHLDGPHGKIPVGQYKIGMIASTQRPHLTNSVMDDQQVSDREWAKREGMAAFAGYPLTLGDRTVGVVAMFSRRPVTAAVLEGLASVANSIALGVDRKRAEESLREREERYRRLADAMPQIVWVTQPDGYHEYFNFQWYEYTGLTYEQTKGEGWNKVFHPDDQARAWRRWRHSLATGRPYEIEYRCRRHDGEYRWFLGRALPQRDERGRIVRWFGTCTDIHDFKQAQAERDRALTMLDLQVERMPLAYLLTDPDFRFVRWNPSAERIFGYPEAEVVGKHPFDVIVPPVSQPVVGAIFGRLQAGDMNAHGRCENVTRDGRVIVCEWHNTPLFTADGTFQGILSLAQDVTERARAEAALRLRDRAIQAVTQGILITDPSQPDNPIVYASPGFERLTGYRAGEVVGRNCRFLQGVDTSPSAVARIREAVHEGRPCTVEVLNYRKDGTPFWNELSISPVVGPDGRLTHFVGVQADVTDRRRLEEQYRQSQKMEAIGQLAGGVAHDFNNLLTVINGYGEIILDQLPPDDPTRDLIREVVAAGDRAAGLTRQLLTFSRRAILELKVLDLREVVADLDRMLRRIIGEDIQLSFVSDPQVGMVRADPGQVEQVVMNLVVNARDAMPRGGRLTIEVRDAELDEHYVRDHPDVRPGAYVLIAVSDTGCGMDRATLGRIFEPFFSTKGEKGTGLGLATVYGIVKQSGGHIAVYSEVGQGTTFRIYLPRIEQRVLIRRSHPGVVEMPRGTETLLLVEDEDGVRALARHVLQACGYTVLEATDGAEAVRLAEQAPGPIHLLMTDVVLPRVGGREVADRVRALHPGVGVLFSSGYTDDAVVRHGILEAEVAFLQKPFRPALLAAKVREVLDGLPHGGRALRGEGGARPGAGGVAGRQESTGGSAHSAPAVPPEIRRE